MPNEPSVMKMQTVILLLLHISLNSFEESQAVNPGCTCIVFTSTYGKDRGTFHSPDYPQPYPAGIDCLLFTFLAAPNEIIEITFNDFNVYKNHMDCLRGDYLKLYQHIEKGEINEYSPWSGVLCGGRSDVPITMYSSGPALVMEFHTLEFRSARPANSTGFTGHFKFIDRRLFQSEGQKSLGTMCDFQFVSAASRPSHGKFYSPRYPATYPKNVRCSYTFKGRLKERIRILFEEITLQKGDISCLNRADIIKVFDGRDLTSPYIAMLCNENAEYEVLSTGPELFVEFIANSELPGQGFKASFQFQPIEDATSADAEASLATNLKSYTIIGPEVSAATSSCDAVFSSDAGKSGSWSSPLYPSPYPPRSHCRYDFQGRGKERIRIVFQEFNLYHPTDDARECETIDALQAYIHIDGRMEKIDSFCGSNLPRPIMSNGPRMMMEFRGLYSSRYSRGFKASYQFIENFGVTTGRQLSEFPCGFVYNSSEARNGTFASPNYPGAYPRDTECHYFFHGNPREKVHLHFTYFDVEGVLPCEAISASDYVEFSNYMTRDRKYNRYCGQLKELHIESDSKFFRVTFRSNDRLDGTGFQAEYQFLDEVEVYSTRLPIGNSVRRFGADGLYALWTLVIWALF